MPAEHLFLFPLFSRTDIPIPILDHLTLTTMWDNINDNSYSTILHKS